ncbi:LuxR C-terminal-related transcriptional regulator [Enterobacter sp. CC120223-11]|uniref:LuxR C-terminal-related transcriptional regulator n=1 Tax=Enterobacter sp. CC120223-11 TaxID=1378073 RepID=UPI000BCEF181|nr:LuxR C-terminal-related transcriptional regulator [Enterobacter sp. CC120223-11]SNY61418.1 two-component system, NarL family, captular synthesis response regulator RcsB [Enterobacter sp. CC120223-11]
MRKGTDHLKVAVFYDFSVFQQVISHHLEKEIQLCRIEILFIRTMETLLSALAEGRVDVLFTEFDFLSNNKSWASNAKKLNRLCIENDVKRVMLVTNQHPYLLRHIIDMKFEATLSLSEGTSGFRKVIEVIQQPENIPFVSDLLTRNMVDGDDREFPLSPKEWEVLYLVAQGYSISDIAKRKSRAVSTVATQKQNAMRKLNLSSNSELIKYMYVSGMME